MSECEVDLSGERKQCEIVKENDKTVLVRIPLTKKAVIRKHFIDTPTEVIGTFGRRWTEATEVKKDRHNIVNRHKVKHNFERV